LKEDRWVIIIIMVLCNANAIIEYDRSRPGLSSAPVDMEYDNNSTEIYASKHNPFSRIHVPEAWQQSP